MTTPAPQPETTSPRPLWRRLMRVVVVTLVWVALFEGAAWGADALWGFRAKLLQGLSLVEPSQDPIPPLEKLPWPQDVVMVRAPDPTTARPEPYVLGMQPIPNAYMNPSQTLAISKMVATDPRKQLFVLGGSAAFGYTVAYKQSAAGMLERSLSKSHLVFNVAQVGWPSGHMVSVARRIARDFKPAVLVIMSGNNEWLRWVPNDQPWLSPEQLETYRTLAHSRALAGALFLGMNQAVLRPKAPAPAADANGGPRGAPGDPARPGAAGRGSADGPADPQGPFRMHASLYGYRYALKHAADRDAPYETARWLQEKQRFLDAFAAHLREMVTLGEDKGARVILLTVPFNHRLNIAWKHPQPEAPAPDTRAEVKALLKTAVPLVDAGSCPAALVDLDAAVALDPTSPLVHYLRGHCLAKLDRKLEAEAAYAQAREHMVGNLGSRLSVNRVIRRVAKETGAELVDVQALFTKHERDRGGFFNEHLIYDDCHPNALGQRLIAMAVDNLLKGR